MISTLLDSMAINVGCQSTINGVQKIVDAEVGVAETAAAMRTVTPLLVFLLTLLVLAILPAGGTATPSTEEKPITIAHRGYAAMAPENTLSSIEAALRAGATTIEVDIQMTADGKIVLMHDRTVDRTTDGSGQISDLTWEYVATLDAGSWFGDDYAGEPIPRIHQALASVMRADVTLAIEVKHPAKPIQARRSARGRYPLK